MDAGSSAERIPFVGGSVEEGNAALQRYATKSEQLTLTSYYRDTYFLALLASLACLLLLLLLRAGIEFFFSFGLFPSRSRFGHVYER